MTQNNGTRPPIHALVYGEPFAGKSYFNATMPVPHLVFFFDAIGKDNAYLQHGQVQDKDEQGNALVNAVGCPMKRVWDQNGGLLFQVEYFHEREWVWDNIEGAMVPKPKAFELFNKRLLRIEEEAQWFRTISIDSLTFLENSAFFREKYKVNPNAKDPRQWYGGTRNVLSETLLARLSMLQCNVTVLAHEKVTELEKTKEILRGINVVGSLIQALPAGFSEMYRLTNVPGKGRMLQTQKNHQWPANSEFAPDPCAPYYEALFQGQQQKG